jgi:hypothetical protein
MYHTKALKAAVPSEKKKSRWELLDRVRALRRSNDPRSPPAGSTDLLIAYGIEHARWYGLLELCIQEEGNEEAGPETRMYKAIEESGLNIFFLSSASITLLHYLVFPIPLFSSITL